MPVFGFGSTSLEYLLQISFKDFGIFSSIVVFSADGPNVPNLPISLNRALARNILHGLVCISSPVPFVAIKYLTASSDFPSVAIFSSSSSFIVLASSSLVLVYMKDLSLLVCLSEFNFFVFCLSWSSSDVTTFFFFPFQENSVSESECCSDSCCCCCSLFSCCSVQSCQKGSGSFGGGCSPSVAHCWFSFSTSLSSLCSLFSSSLFFSLSCSVSF